jgi:AcrR family transcriptional regulator
VTVNVAPPPNTKRAATHARICDTANALFFAQGFAAVTMEEIARAAGIRRSTLYLYFRDKEEILAAIAEDYTNKLREVIARLPGPEPTREEIEVWVEEFADFVTSERASTEVLVSLSHLPNAPAAAIAFGEELKQMMAERLAAFKRALEPGQPLAFAWAMSTLDGLGWALCHHARAGGSDISKSRLTVAAAALNRFVRGEF